jgi:gamma-glutamyltranspeptidase / glutathione hydrolase
MTAGRAERGRAIRGPLGASALVGLWLACTPAAPHNTPPNPLPRATAEAAAEPARALEHRVPAAAHAVAVGKRAAVSSAEPLASQVGIDVLQRGGNAVDAAVAVAFALGVTHPSAGSIGGGGFMLVRAPDGANDAIDYREVAPGAAHRAMYLDPQGQVTSLSEYGPLAAGIPGVVAGLGLAHRLYGTRPWAELVAPAIELARQGHALDTFHAVALAGVREDLLEYQAELETRRLAEPKERDPARAIQLERLARAVRATFATFTGPGGAALRAGDVWRQPELAATLETIAREGAGAFYRGPLAERMAAGVFAMGGVWTPDDLGRYAALQRRPLVFEYHGHEIVTMPPPSAGGPALRQILLGAELLSLNTLDWDSPARMHLYVEVLRRAYADRNEWMGDPDFVDMPLEQLLSRPYAAGRVASIDPDHATPSRQVRAGTPYAEPSHTTHFSIVDGAGMAVANTFTLNTDFGASLQIPGTGVTLNNEMDDFTTKPGAPNLFGLVQGLQNAIAPGKRMLSSMSPTIVARGGHLRAVLGSPGGPTIISTVAQILMQLVDHQRSLEAAIAAPRLHHQWLPDEIQYEPGLAAGSAEALSRLGHTLRPTAQIGHANCIEVDPTTGAIRAVADVQRLGGGAAAY